MSQLARIINVCHHLNVSLDDVELIAGHKQVFFTLPGFEIDSLRDEDGELAEKYDEFCDQNDIYYYSEYDCWS